MEILTQVIEDSIEVSVAVSCHCCHMTALSTRLLHHCFRIAVLLQLLINDCFAESAPSLLLPAEIPIEV